MKRFRHTHRAKGPAALFTLLLFAATATAQPRCLAEQQSAIESRQYRYDTHWVCTGDTLESAESAEHGTVYLIDGFWMTCCEVTQDLFEWHMNYNPSAIKGALYPVTGVSVAEADTFCHRLSVVTRRQWCIPTAAEWWFAYHGGLFSEGYRYSGSSRLNLVAWTAENSDGTLHVGAQRIGNELELYDMDGNVAEMAIDGDSIRYLGGSYLTTASEAAATTPAPHSIPPECRGLRIVSHAPLWFTKYGNVILNP